MRITTAFFGLALSLTASAAMAAELDTALPTVADLDLALTAPTDGGDNVRRPRRGRRPGQRLRRRIKRVCARANFTAEQKQAIRASLIELRKEQIDLRAEVKKARVDFRAKLLDNGATRGDLDALAGTLADHRAAVIKNRLDFKADLALSLAPEQKRPGIRCVNLLLQGKKKRGQRRGGLGRGGRRGPGANAAVLERI